MIRELASLIPAPTALIHAPAALTLVPATLIHEAETFSLTSAPLPSLSLPSTLPPPLSSNHYELTRKDLMVKNLKRMKRQLERDDRAGPSPSISSHGLVSPLTDVCPPPFYLLRSPGPPSSKKPVYGV